MAKLGEGAPEWIVEERADGQNVNNWHWTERNVLGWCKQRFGELLADGLEVVGGSGNIWVKTTDLQSLTGDAVINNRKGKTIPSYELEAKVGWTGEIKDGEGTVVGTSEGTIHFPYIADENHDEDPELRVSTSTEGSVQQRLKTAILANGKKVLQERVAQFVKELRAGGPSSSEAGPPAAEKGAKKTKVLDQQPIPKPATAAQKKKEDAKRRSTIELTERFYARAVDLYACFTEAPRVMAFTSSPAVIEPRVGGRFCIFDNNVTGTFEELEPGKRIVLSWRFKNWEDSVLSKVVLELEEVESGTTVLRLVHTGIPEIDKFGNEEVVSITREGWIKQIFYRIRNVFGFGA